MIVRVGVPPSADLPNAHNIPRPLAQSVLCVFQTPVLEATQNPAKKGRKMVGSCVPSALSSKIHINLRATDRGWDTAG